VTDAGIAPPSTWPAARGTVQQAIDADVPDRAFEILATALASAKPGLLAHEKDEALLLLSRVLASQSRTNGADPAPRATDNPLAVGAILIDRGRPDVAAGVLGHAVDRAPGDARLLAELIAALELAGRHREAVDYLERVPELVRSDPLLVYLRAFNAIFVGDLDTPLELLPRLQASMDETIRFMAARIERMLGRADAVRARSGLSPADQRGWHFVLTGGLLLSAASGQPGYGDSDANIRRNVQGLIAVLEAWQLRPARVLFPPERNSAILAHVIARALGQPAVGWTGGAEPGLVVVYDPYYVIPEIWRATRAITPGQVVFVHMLGQTRENPVAPDILTGFYRRNAPPWGPGFDPHDNYIPPIDGPPEDLAATIMHAYPEDDDSDDLSQLTRFAEALADFPPALRPTALQNTDVRERLWVGSPARRG